MPKIKHCKILGFNPCAKTAPKWAQKAARAYYHQLHRCNSPKDADYKTYGAKGIRVEYSLVEFLSWYKENMPRGRARYSIGRKDHSKNYRLDNVEFQTLSENSSERIARLGTPVPRKAVVTVDLVGRHLQRFPSIRAAADYYGMAFQNVSTYLKTGKPNKVHRVYFREDRCGVSGN